MDVFYRLKENPLNHINENMTVIESNYVKLLQEQNIALIRQLQETKWKLCKFDIPIEQTSSNEISKDIQEIETSLVGLKNAFYNIILLLYLCYFFFFLVCRTEKW